MMKTGEINTISRDYRKLLMVHTEYCFFVGLREGKLEENIFYYSFHPLLLGNGYGPLIF